MFQSGSGHTVSGFGEFNCALADADLVQAIVTAFRQVTGYLLIPRQLVDDIIDRVAVGNDQCGTFQ